MKRVGVYDKLKLWKDDQLWNQTSLSLNSSSPLINYESYLPSLHFSFLICKMEMVIPTLQDCCEQ